MSFQNPLMIVVALLVALALALAYRWLQRRRSSALAAAGLSSPAPGWAGLRRHIPPLMFLVALTLLLLALARPQATVAVPRISGTVVLTFDVSNSMAAKDVEPTRLGAAQAAAVSFVQAQPDTVDIGVVAFGQGALTTRQPSADHDGAIAAIKRLTPAGGTSLGTAILTALTTIIGKPVSLPDPDSNAPSAEYGYWGSATIVLLSDGEDTGGPDAVAAAEVAAAAGVHIETIGIGTVEGATIEVDGFQVATALNEDLLTEVAQTTTGSYHRAQDAQQLDDVTNSLNLRATTNPEFLELTGPVVGFALVLLTIGGMFMISWFGRIL
jgi:Ca-activated chloride channel family protein